MPLVETWRSDGARAMLQDEEDSLWATLELRDDWYLRGSREPVRAWVVEWLDRSGSKPQMARARLDAPEEPALDETSKAQLSKTGATIARAEPAPGDPAPFGHAKTGLSEGSEIHSRIELISFALQEAAGRLGDAARITEPWGVHQVLVALTETVGWVRALDDAMNHVWRRLSDEQRSDVTRRIDEALERPGWNQEFVEWAKEQRDASGYRDWTLGLLLRNAGISREDLRGMRWLAGKLLHFGPLPAVELRQWREGEAPRWKWRPSCGVFPATGAERRAHDRLAYDTHLAGRDLIGSFNLFDALFAAEFLAWDLTGQPET